MNNDSTVTAGVGEELEQETSALVQFFSSVDWQSMLVNFAITILKVLVVALVVYAAYRFFTYLLNRFFKHQEGMDHKMASKYVTLKNLLQNVLKALAWFIFAYTALGLFGVPVGTLLAGAGVIGLAVSLGAQGFVNDFINGFRIIFEEQMHVGDNVVLEDIDGIVEQVGLQTTVIRAWDGTFHYIPNREIIIVGNKSRSSLRALVEIPLYTDTDLDKVRLLIEEANQRLFEEFGDAITQKPSSVDFIPYSTGQVAAQVIMYTRPDDVFAVKYKAFELYVDVLTDAGIDLPDFVLPLAK